MPPQSERVNNQIPHTALSLTVANKVLHIDVGVHQKDMHSPIPAEKFLVRNMNQPGDVGVGRHFEIIEHRR
ncbi:hypothetical protein D3C85_1163700 [compost metagenome]